MKKSILFFAGIFYCWLAWGNQIPYQSAQQLQRVLKNQDITSGAFIKFNMETPFYLEKIDLGKVDIHRYTACYRNQSCWMVPSIGNQISLLPEETQFLLIEETPDKYTMYIPLIDNVTRCSLAGGKDDALFLIAETGDTLTTGNTFLGLYVLKGNNPHQMVKQAMEDIAKETGCFRLKTDKPTPWFVGHFGWGTYNAFYENLTSEKIKKAMRNFQNKNIPLPYLLLDVGWQSTTGSQLAGFDIDRTKFPEGLKSLIYDLKTDYGVQKVMIWQAMWGYWQGLNGHLFPEQSRKVSFLPPPQMNWMLDKKGDFKHEQATAGIDYYPGFLGEDMYIPHFSSYYQESFDFLRKEGVDAVKIDAITWIEANGNGQGGRIKLMNELLTGLQSAAAIHFNNELLNCSASSNDYLFQTLTANVTRTSTDFFPDIPESHGMHIFTNAHTSFWMGDIILPDWDMFQSGHPAGDFHAAARAISGGPVYSSDEVGKENKTILMKLMSTKGEIPLCTEAARICKESLFTDPYENRDAIKIYNRNRYNGVVGVFNCCYSQKEEIIVKDKVSISDIEGIEGDEFILYSGRTGEFRQGNPSTHLSATLKHLEHEIFTIAPICNGFAPIGIISMYNPGGTILEKSTIAENMITMKLLEGGTFIAYSAISPQKIFCDKVVTDFIYDTTTGMLTIELPECGRQDLIIQY